MWATYPDVTENKKKSVNAKLGVIQETFLQTKKVIYCFEKILRDQVKELL